MVKTQQMWLDPIVLKISAFKHDPHQQQQKHKYMYIQDIHGAPQARAPYEI